MIANPGTMLSDGYLNTIGFTGLSLPQRALLFTPLATHAPSSFDPMTWATRAGCFQGYEQFHDLFPGLSLALQPWASISQRLRRKLGQRLQRSWRDGVI